MGWMGGEAHRALLDLFVSSKRSIGSSKAAGDSAVLRGQNTQTPTQKIS